jgi:hypothetical protein
VIATSGGAAPENRRSERQGTWACAAGTLALAWVEGPTETLEVTFGDSGVLLGNELWTRTPERPDSPDDEQAGGGDDLE